MGIIEDLQLQLDSAKDKFAQLSAESQSGNQSLANIASRSVGGAAANLSDLENQLARALREQESSFVIEDTTNNNNIKNVYQPIKKRANESLK